MNNSQAIDLTIDFVDDKLYWIDDEGSVWESNFDFSFKRCVFFDGIFMPFKLEIVRNFIVLTSIVNSSYVIVNKVDLSASHVNNPLNASYYAVSSLGILKKPMKGSKKFLAKNVYYFFVLGKYNCLRNNKCSHFCEEKNQTEHPCSCPENYRISDDGINCLSMLISFPY